jgi:preprotein translocase subunit SecE
LNLVEEGSDPFFLNYGQCPRYWLEKKESDPERKASSSIGRAAVSKTAGWGFDSLLACQAPVVRWQLDELHRVPGKMDAKVDSKPTIMDSMLLLIAVAIVVGSIFAYYYYAEAWVLLRSIGVLIALGVAIWVAMQSAQGRTLWAFIQGSRVELRKVVWPTREETVQTTLIVLVFATIMGTFFWLLDIFLLWFTRFLTG